MTNGHTSARARGSDGSEIAVQQVQSDAPILPIGSIERLHAIRPDRVDWIFEQAEIEAASRRDETQRVNRFIFFERLLGQLIGALVGIIGVGGGLYAGLHGQPWLGGIIASAMISVLAVAFIARAKQD